MSGTDFISKQNTLGIVKDVLEKNIDKNVQEVLQEVILKIKELPRGSMKDPLIMRWHALHLVKCIKSDASVKSCEHALRSLTGMVESLPSIEEEV